MSFLGSRRAKLSPSQRRAVEAETRRQIAVAVSIAERKAKALLEAAINAAETENATLVKRIDQVERQARSLDRLHDVDA